MSTSYFYIVFVLLALFAILDIFEIKHKQRMLVLCIAILSLFAGLRPTVLKNK